jgi:hypothetical protein
MDRKRKWRFQKMSYVTFLSIERYPTGRSNERMRVILTTGRSRESAIDTK